MEKFLDYPCRKSCKKLQKIPEGIDGGTIFRILEGIAGGFLEIFPKEISVGIPGIIPAGIPGGIIGGITGESAGANVRNIPGRNPREEDFP